MTKLEKYSKLFVESFDNDFSKLITTDNDYIDGCPSKTPINVPYEMELFKGLPYHDSSLFEKQSKIDGLFLSDKIKNQISAKKLNTQIHLKNKDIEIDNISYIKKEKCVVQTSKKSKINFIFYDGYTSDAVYYIQVFYGFDYQFIG